MADFERELGWDDPIENDGPEFYLLPEGDYNFKVLSMERARHQGSAKLPPCNKAVLKLLVTAADGRCTTIKSTLFLHSRTEGLLCAFFTSIGERRHGERLVPNWSHVIDATGRCKVGIRTSERDGNQYNEIKKFLEPNETQAIPAPQGGGWTPGAF